LKLCHLPITIYQYELPFPLPHHLPNYHLPITNYTLTPYKKERERERERRRERGRERERRVGDF